MPEGIFAMIKGRSFLASRGVDVGAGLIDNDYTGELKILLINNSDTAYHIEKHARIAQIVFFESCSIHFEQIFSPNGLSGWIRNDTPNTRGSKGWGSSGML